MPDADGASTAWFTVIGRASPRVRVVTTALRRRGLMRGTVTSAAHPGIVVLSGPSMDLHDVLREASAVGARVLVALVGDRVSCDPWSLLVEGAEDVVAVEPDEGVDEAVARVDRWAAVDALVESDAVRARNGPDTLVRGIRL